MVATTNQGTVLVADDEPQLVELYAAWLGDTYTVRTATNGEEALEQLDETVDVVLLDRQMPERSGSDVLAAIRDRGMNCRVAMISAVKPDLDVIDMGFDDYLVKPVSKEDVVSLVDTLLARSAYDDTVQRFFALVSKRAVLMANLNDGELTESDAYQKLEQRIAVAEKEAQEALDNVLDDQEFNSVFRDFETEIAAEDNQFKSTGTSPNDGLSPTQEATRGPHE